MAGWSWDQQSTPREGFAIAGGHHASHPPLPSPLLSSTAFWSIARAPNGYAFCINECDQGGDA